MPYVVTVPATLTTASGVLKGTIVSANLAAATVHATAEDAQHAIQKACKFYKPSIVRKMRIERV